MKDTGFTQTYTREYAYEFKLNNRQYVYVKRLMDTKKITPEPSRLMIHPALVALKEDLQKVENAEFNFEEKGDMNSTFSQFPKCKQSECDKSWTEYGIGVNFNNKNRLMDLLQFIESF